MLERETKGNKYADHFTSLAEENQIQNTTAYKSKQTNISLNFY